MERGASTGAVGQLRHTLPIGEAKCRALAARRGEGQGSGQPHVVDTLGGHMHVRWNECAVATPQGQRMFFAEFLATTSVFVRWVSQCPLA